jgi:8-oxo-dGTP pyrophosphatase MutT (NUDIX family)
MPTAIRPAPTAGPRTCGSPGARWTSPPTQACWDNLIGGGVPDGQTPLQALHREAWEEAGLLPADLAGLRAGRVIHLLRDIPEGLQREALLQLRPAPASRPCVPHNQDGEVAGFELLPVPTRWHACG